MGCWYAKHSTLPFEQQLKVLSHEYLWETLCHKLLDPWRGLGGLIDLYWSQVKYKLVPEEAFKDMFEP